MVFDRMGLLRGVSRKQAVRRQNRRLPQSRISRKQTGRPPLNRSDNPRRIVRRQPSRTIGRNLAGTSRLREHKLRQRMSVRNLNGRLPQKPGLQRNNNSTRSLCLSNRNRRSLRKKSRSKTRNRNKEDGKRGLNILGILKFQDAFFLRQS